MAKKIGLVLALDGEREFVQAVQNARKETKLFETQLKGLDKECEGNANTLETLEKRHDLLKKTQKSASRAVEEANKGLKKAEENYSKIGKEVEDYEKQLEDARAALKKMEESGDTTSKSYGKQQKQVQQLSKDLDKLRSSHTKEAGSITDWNKRVYESESALKKADKELSKNSKYLDEARNSADKCATSIDEFGKEVSSLSEDLEEAADKTAVFEGVLGGNLASSGIEKGLELVGKGIEAVKESMYDISGASSNLAAQTGATTQQMESYKDTMLSIRGNNFGEDYNDVSDAMATVIQTMGELNDVELQDVTESAITLRDSFGMDYQESLRAVKMLMDQFGVSSEEAFNLIVQGTQQGLNKNGDLLDSINEYSVHYKQMGLSADDFFNSLKNGTDAGTFSVDKLGDAYKEFGIRVKDTATTTDEAYQLLGLNADEMRKQFAKGGESAEKATKTVLDALFSMDDQVAQNQAGVDLFGTMWEDLGITGVQALTNVEGSISSVGSAMDDLKKTKYNDLESAVSGFGAAVQENIVTPIADTAIPVVTGLFEKLTDVVGKLGEEKTELETFIEDIGAANAEVQVTLDNAQSTLDGATANTATLEAYKQTLLDLNQQEQLTEFQKYQIANAVQTLGDSVPGLAEAFDKETGALRLTNDELVEMFDNAEAIAMQKALIKAQAESYDALAEATINKAKADSAAETAMSNLTEKQEQWYEEQKKGIDSSSALEEEVISLAETLGDAEDAQEDANNQCEEAKRQIDEENKALEKLKEQYGLTTEGVEKHTDATEETTDAMSDVGDAVAETKKELDALGRDISNLSEEEKEVVKESAQEIADAYDSMKGSIEDSIESSISIFDKFAEQTPITVNDMIEALDSQIAAIEQWKTNMETLTGKIGNGMSQELYDSLVQMGPEQTAAAAQELVRAAEEQTADFEAVSNKWEKALELKTSAETLADSTAAGKERIAAYAGGTREAIPDAEEATTEVSEATLKKLQENEENFKQTAQTAVNNYATALANGTMQAAAAAGTLGRSAYENLLTYQTQFYSAGVNMAAGVAQGIRDGQSSAINAASRMASQALRAAKKELEIQSPSRKFRREVGAQIGKGTAFGISDTASLAGDEATKMSANVYKKATSWLNKYKKSHKVSLADEQYFWQQVVKHTKNGTAACTKAMNQLSAANNKLIGGTLNKQISNNFGVSWKEDSNADVFSDGQKSVGDYYGEVYNAAKKTLNNYKVLHDMSLEQEIAYWEKVKKTLMTGTDVWYDVTATISSLKEDIVARDEAANNAILENGEKYIDRQKILGDVSTAQELAFWKKKIKQVEKDSDAYYEILEKINDLEAQKIEEQKERLQSLASTQDKILSDYKTYYKVSAQAEVEYWNVARQQFQAGTQERIDADKKYFDALQEFNDKRIALDEDYAEKSKEINEELKSSAKELQDAYHDAVASRKQDILSSMNLFEEWNTSGYDANTLVNNLKTQVEGLALWEQQLEKLKQRGITTELYDYLLEQGPDASANVMALANATEQQLKEYQELFKKRSELAQSQAIKDNEKLLKETNDQIAKLNKDAQKELDDLNKEYIDAVSKLQTGMSSELGELITNAEKIGEDTVAGLVGAIDKKADAVETYDSTTKVVNKVTSALELLEESGKKIGSDTLENILKEMQNNKKIETAVENIVQTAMKSVKYQMEKAMEEEYGSLSNAGLTKLNRALESAPSQQTVVNVDNRGIAEKMDSMVEQVKDMADKMSNLQVVMYPDTVAGALQPVLSQENATAAVRRNRGRL